MVILLTLIAVLFFAGVYYFTLKWIYAEKDEPDELHFVKTDDGAKIALHRYRPQGVSSSQDVVFFCHGLGANKFNLDFNSTFSLARYMSERGYDSWVISLRGAEPESVKGFIKVKNWDFNFDTFVEQDIRCAIDYILKTTGKTSLHWVGHSMGGMLLYAYAIRWGNNKIKSGVTLGSPVRFSKTDRHVKFLINTDFLLKKLKRLRLDIFAQFFAPLTGRLRSRFVTHQMNPLNVDFNVIRRAQFNAVTPLSTKLLLQFKDWLEHDGFWSYNKSLNYSENLDKIKIPCLVVAGGKDKMAPVEDVKYAFEQISSPDKDFILLSRSSGFSADYGHIDIVFGKRAPEEVFPRILDWIEKHRG